MMAQGFAFTGSQLRLLGLRLPKIGPLSQGLGGVGLRLPTRIVPPAVFPAASMVAPVGMLASPKLLLNARKDCQFTVSYDIPAPPRSTVLPLPVTSQANPKRGAKFL